MTQLPNDVLIEIFLHLHQIDKVECMLVCHHWKRIIENSVLYHTIILRKTANLNTLATKVKVDPEIGKKIQQFIILDNGTNENEIDLSEFLSLLSNLRMVLSFKDFALDGRVQYSWYTSIKHIDHRTNPIFFHLLSSCIYPNLVTLFTCMDKEKRIIQLLKHAPELSDLTMTDGKINFSDLNTLHDNTPRLKSITLNDIFIENTEFDDIVHYPTTVVSKCHYYTPHLKELQTVIDLLVYTSKKHPNLSELHICTNYMNMNFNEEHTSQLYTYGWSPFFKNVGIQLKKLCIIDSVNVDFPRLFRALDKFKHQIRNLAIPMNESDTLTSLVQSQQIHYIETLTLNLVEEQTFEWLKELYVLKNLKLSARQLFTQLDDILDYSPPTLRSLTLKHTYVAIRSNGSEESHLEILCFEAVSLPETIDYFINQHFPKLSDLSLIDCLWVGKIWKLATINLSVFRFNFYFIKTYTVLIKAYNNNESRFYHVNDSIYFREMTENNHFYERPYKLTFSNESKYEIMFTLCCYSVKNVHLITRGYSEV